MEIKMNKNIVLPLLVLAFLVALVYAAPVFNSIERVNISIDLRADQQEELQDKGYGNYSYYDDTQEDYVVRYLKSNNGLPMPHSPKIKTYIERCVLWNETYVIDDSTIGYNILTDYEDRLRDTLYSEIECIQENRFNYTSEEISIKLDEWQTKIMGNYADVSISRKNVSVSNITRTGDVVIGGGRE